MRSNSNSCLYSLGINAAFEDISALSYPTWLTDTAGYLPDIDLTCVTSSGMNFFNESIANSTSATITSLLHAIRIGCSSSTLVISGGYDYAKEELEINLLLETSKNLNM